MGVIFSKILEENTLFLEAIYFLTVFMQSMKIFFNSFSSHIFYKNKDFFILFSAIPLVREFVLSETREGIRNLTYWLLAFLFLEEQDSIDSRFFLNSKLWSFLTYE